jgi:hypothetical protein
LSAAQRKLRRGKFIVLTWGRRREIRIVMIVATNGGNMVRSAAKKLAPFASMRGTRDANVRANCCQQYQ